MGGEGVDRGWDGWMASPAQWAWVWWGTGKPGVLQFMGSQRVRHDWATELNWTEDGEKTTTTQNTFLGGTIEGWCLLLNMFSLRWLYPCIDFKGPIRHSVERYMWKYKFGSLVLWPPDVNNWLIGKDADAGKDWRWEEKGMIEGEMVEWHHRFNGHEFEQAQWVGDGQGSLVCCRPWGRRVGHDWLHWTELWYKR